MHYGRLGRQVRGGGCAKAVSPHGHACAVEFQPPLLERKPWFLVRRGQWRSTRSLHPPNQIFAVSLPHSMLPWDRARKVVEKVEQRLLTPFGLRTLAPSDPRYRGSYTGSPAERDGAYHQGTVWPWLLGPFITAYIKVNGGREEARRQAQAWLSPLESHLMEAGLGHVSEIFEGDAPHRPCGCIAQAWSVAEILRVYSEELTVRPLLNFPRISHKTGAAADCARMTTNP